MIRWLKTRRFASLQAVSWTRRDTRARSGSGRNRNQLSHLQQVVSCGRKDENTSYLEQSAVFQLAQQRDDFQPAETFLDAFPPFLADVVAGMPRAARINGTVAGPSRVLRHVRRHIHAAALVDEFHRAESLVAADRDATIIGNLLQHQKRRIALGPPVDLEQLRIHDVTLLIINSPYDFVLTAHCVELKQLFQHPASVVCVEG
jgi:hypothetical protein